jgi:hypothetical protein
MGILTTLKEGGSLRIDSMGGSPHVDYVNRVDEDLDLLPEPLVGLGVIKMGVGSMGV